MINFSIKELNAFAVIGQEVELTNYQKKNIQISTQFWRKEKIKVGVKNLLLRSDVERVMAKEQREISVNTSTIHHFEIIFDNPDFSRLFVPFSHDTLHI